MKNIKLLIIKKFTKLRVGKISPKLLKEIVYKNLGVFNERVLLGPSIGEDAAIIDMRKNFGSSY